MSKELEFWKFAAEKLKQNEAVIFLIVAESSGSSPGRQGFKMLVARDKMRGSIGGGVMETRLVEQTRDKIKEAKSSNESQILNLRPRIIEQVHRKNSPNSSGMLCSGKQTVISHKLDFSHLETVEKIILALEKNQSKRLRISNAGLRISNSQNEDFKFEQFSENEFVYEENLGCKNRIYIIGGGHCALALSEIISKLDFHITLFDDRADLNTIGKNVFADEIMIIESYEKIGDFVESGENNYVVVMTLGYKFDEIVIRKLFDKNFRYFGVLGSRAKMKMLLKNLENEGFDKNRLNKIHTPIGLKINSRMPEEIAVSIAAEIIAVKNSKS